MDKTGSRAGASGEAAFTQGAQEDIKEDAPPEANSEVDPLGSTPASTAELLRRGELAEYPGDLGDPFEYAILRTLQLYVDRYEAEILRMAVQLGGPRSSAWASQALRDGEAMGSGSGDSPAALEKDLRTLLDYKLNLQGRSEYPEQPVVEAALRCARLMYCEDNPSGAMGGRGAPPEANAPPGAPGGPQVVLPPLFWMAGQPFLPESLARCGPQIPTRSGEAADLGLALALPKGPTGSTGGAEGRGRRGGGRTPTRAHTGPHEALYEQAEAAAAIPEHPGALDLPGPVMGPVSALIRAALGDMVSQSEAARVLGVGDKTVKDTLDRLSGRGYLRYLRIGWHVLLCRDSVEREASERQGVPSEEDGEPLMGVEEVASALGVSASTVRRYVRQGSLSVARSGYGMRFARADVEDFLG